MKKIFKILLIMIILLTLAFFLGPKPDHLHLAGSMPQMTQDLGALDQEINKREASNKEIKEGNEADIIWLDENNKTKTEYALLYLPGFSGSHYEAEPLHKEIGVRYGLNVFLARLQAHGMNKEEALLDFDGEKYLQSAREALAVAENIGEKVIIMSTSTGSTLALYLAAENPEVFALINYSPNIDLYDPRAGLLNGPWGLQIARLVKGSDYHEWEAEPWAYKYWNMKYRLEGLVELKEFIDETMTEETFAKIKQPFFMGHWYKNDEEKDKTVSIDRMLEMYDQINTAESLKTSITYPDAKTHVIACKTRSAAYDKLRNDTFSFMETTLEILPLSPSE